MNTAISINDLEINNDLDQSAMAAVIGGARVAWEYTGSSIGRMSSWRYTGRYFRRFVGNSYLSGKGWSRKYRTATSTSVHKLSGPTSTSSINQR